MAASLLSHGFPAAAVAAQRGALERATHDTVLGNGLEVIVVENHAIPLATVNLVVRTGAYTQEPGDEGISHLYEHMLFKGYRGLPDETFGQAAAELTAGYNGTTSEEAVTYYLYLPSDEVSGAMSLLSRIVRADRFDEAELSSEKFVVLGEYNRALANPNRRLAMEVSRRLWGDAWGRKNVIGTQVSVLGVTPERLEAVFDTYYVPNNAALIVTGDVRRAEVVEMADRHFDDWDRRPDPFAANPVPPITPLEASSGVVLHSEDVDEVTVLIQWQGPSVTRDEEFSYAADVFSALVNQSGSTFQKRLVDSGLLHAVTMSYESLNHSGPITIRARTSSEKLIAALAALKREIQQLHDSGYFSEEELAIVRKQLEVGSALEQERASALAHTIGFWWSVAGIDHYYGYADGLMRQDLDVLRLYAARYITNGNRVIGLLLPSENADVGAEALENFLALEVSS
ncbi:MAG: M16 family metallopeptidase [Gemmatimonadaceae bacterium]